ncbi:MAG: M48 family metalloprotease [Acidobacteria bacterium]|nr:M48 family metalloprotease [Acidobacteriota bacterium]
MNWLNTILCQLRVNTGWLVGYWGACPVVVKLKIMVVLALIVLTIRWLIHRAKLRAIRAHLVPVDRRETSRVMSFANAMKIKGPVQLSLQAKLPMAAACLDGHSIAVNQNYFNDLDREERDGVWCHELAHIKRRDIQRYWAFLIVIACLPLLAIELFGSSFDCEPESLLWLMVSLTAIMGVGVWLLALFYRQEVELMADHMAVSVTHNPHALASALIKAQRWSSKQSTLVTLSLLGGSGLRRRLQQLLHWRPQPKRSWRLPFTFAVIAFTVVFWLAQPQRCEPQSCMTACHMR